MIMELKTEYRLCGEATLEDVERHFRKHLRTGKPVWWCLLRCFYFWTSACRDEPLRRDTTSLTDVLRHRADMLQPQD